MGFFDQIWDYVSGTGEDKNNSLLNTAFYDDKGNLDVSEITEPITVDGTGIASANPAVTNARLSGDQQALGLQALNAANLARQAPPAAITPYTAPDTVVADTSGPASGVVNLLPAIPDFTGDSLRDAASRYIDVSDTYVEPYSQNAGLGRGSYAAGGIAKLREGRYLAGATDGMADKIPAEIDQVQPAALSDGEYVIPADVVSHLGNGNSDAGAEVLDEFLTKVRKSRTGNGEQGKQIDPNKLLPKVLNPLYLTTREIMLLICLVKAKPLQGRSTNLTVAH